MTYMIATPMLRFSLLPLGAAILCAAMLMPAPAAAAEAAIKGYDTVAYHLGGPQKGSAKFALDWNGARWHFASEDNKNLFRTNPEKYAPKYNGWCAYAAASNYIAEVDPVRGWSIVGGKLYLNWSAGVKRLWSLRANTYIKRADKNWPGIKQKLADGQADINRK